MSELTRIDVVTAIRNEAEALPHFLDSLRALELPDDVALSVLFVEDGSRDATVAKLRELSDADPSVRYVCLEDGFGQGPAIAYGLSQSSADAVVMLDADGSHPVAAIPRMVDAFQRGAAVVQCRRRSLPGRSWLRDTGTQVFRGMVVALTGESLRDQNIYYRLVDAKVARWIVAQPRVWRFLRIPLPPPAGGRHEVIEVDTQDRVHGQSKYPIGRLAALAADSLLTLMSPLRLMGSGALGCGVAGLLLARSHPVAASITLLGVLAIAARRVHLEHRVGLSDFCVIEASGERASEVSR